MKIDRCHALLSLILLVFACSHSIAQSKRQKKAAGYSSRDYEINCVGIGNQGVKLVHVFGYGETPDEAERRAKRNAVHGVIFRGVPGGTNGCKGIKPLAPSITLEEEREDFFKPFFKKDAGYNQFISLSSEGGDGRQVYKIDKKVFKVGVYLAVSYDKLRIELEKAGIIKKLDAGF